MPYQFSINELQATADRAYREKRSEARIAQFEKYCEEELKRAGLPPGSIKAGQLGRSMIDFPLGRSQHVLGGYYAKEMDVALLGKNSGPLLGISLKAMWTSVQQNVNNRWEEMVGDAANLHNRFPMLALGYLMVLPFMSSKTKRRKSGKVTVPEPLIDASGNPTGLAESISMKLAGVSGREDSTDVAARYEQVALCLFDFSVSPPRLHPAFPVPGSGLRVEHFFERLVSRFYERNKLIPERGRTVDDSIEQEDAASEGETGQPDIESEV